MLTSNNRGRSLQREQTPELMVLVLLYLLQMVNAEMLRRAIGTDTSWKKAPTLAASVIDVITEKVHPFAMGVLGLGLGLMVIGIA